MDEYFIRCECFAEMIHVCRDRDDGEVYMSVYVPRGRGKLAWKYRLQHIWRILTKGYPWQDEIILGKAEAARFGVWLLESEEKKFVDPENLGG